MSQPTGNRLTRRPLLCTVLLVTPIVALMGIALFFTQFRINHAIGLFGMQKWALATVAILGLLQLVLGVATLIGGQPRWRGLVPIATGVITAAFVYVVVDRTQLLQGDATNPGLMADLRQADLTATDLPDAPTGQWPQWRGYFRDGICHETGLNMDWTAQPPSELWRQKIGGGYSSFAVANGRVYTMDRQGNNERVLCFDAEKGDLLWSYRYAVDYSGQDRTYATGPRATPTVFDGRVYAVGAMGHFLCLEAEPDDGEAKVLWQHQLLAEFDAEVPRWGVACSPLIEGDRVIVQPGGAKGSVVAFDRVTGDEVWASLEDEAGYSSPVAGTLAGTRQIICLTGERLVSLDPADGRLLWSQPWHTSFQANIATPIVAGDYVFISTDYGTGCALFQVVRSGGTLRADKVYLRKNKLMRNHHSTCVLWDGYLYGYDSGPNVLKCVDLRTARQMWVTRKLAKGTQIYVDGHLIVLTENGTLALVEATPDGYREKGRVEVFPDSANTWALPVVANGRLYLRDDRHVICFDLRPAKTETTSTAGGDEPARGQ